MRGVAQDSTACNHVSSDAGPGEMLSTIPTTPPGFSTRAASRSPASKSLQWWAL